MNVFTKSLYAKKEEALHDLKTKLLGVETLPFYPQYLPPLSKILHSKKEQALSDLSLQLRHQLGDSGLVSDSSLMSSLMPSVRRLVEEPDLLPALAKTVSRHLMQDRRGSKAKEGVSLGLKDRKPVVCGS